MALCLAVCWMVLPGCDGDNETPATPTEPAPPTTTSKAALRVANLSEDARNIDVAINGELVFVGLDFPAVSPYTTLAPGDYQVQFFESGSRSPTLLQAMLSLAAGETVTLDIVGIDLQVVPIRDDLTTNPTRARVRFFNAVPDFPTSLDLALSNGPVLARDVAYLQASEYLQLVPGIYDLEIRRAGTSEVTAESLSESLLQNSTYTVFAVGALRRDDIFLFVTRDSP